MGSTSTMPLNLALLAGLRTTMRVLYGCPFAVPEMKYSFASYLKLAKPLPGANDCTDSYGWPGPVIGPSTFGSVTAVGFAGGIAWAPRVPPTPGPPRPCPGAAPCAGAGPCAPAMAAI